MLPVNLTAYSSQHGTDLVQKMQKIILDNGCFITDFVTFGPTEMSLSFEGENTAIQKIIEGFRTLDVLFTDYSEYEISFLKSRSGELTIVLYLITGRKKDIGTILDEKFRK